MPLDLRVRVPSQSRIPIHTWTIWRRCSPIIRGSEMADVNALSSLYPQPPQQNNTNALINDPARVIGLMSGLQDFRLKQQQFDALSRQPQATLDNTNIANQTAMMQQQAAASR